ncbi:2,3-dimethylmalate dehydratase large subunit [Clostridium homopropionicum DSM 5847]|uniref:2,3-dimethylmalate dehydratase large subunit n=1 Tax=Clostridium homopropionicum DSM 5847 TaxID=1121318 RepID=A0A0L6Z6U3_9CLOT|nr:hydratase [Clostridium homopropionicum]KOA18548.1 2,3-dimethylmalate dehydratase large subunit [Clostridium homopropionicum DSM 5847]SFF65007.1 aconitate hydratase [Clostridium homopropionicum]
MVEIIDRGVYIYKGKTILGYENKISLEDTERQLKNAGEDISNLSSFLNQDIARKNTIAFDILMKHNKSDEDKKLNIKFDALASHDITYVGITQTAKASGLKEFPIPYILTNCHNSLCTVGGTINEDDHIFGLSAAKKYGGIYVPAHQAVIHQYMREMMASCGSMILGSDSHTRYGSLGTMGIGEGGPELVKQLLGKTYDISYPEVIAVYLEGKPKLGVGPQDVALSIIGTVFKRGFVKNKILEFVGPGIYNLSIDFRNGIDVMTTETTCLSSIWCTDEKVKEYYTIHGRPETYTKLEPGEVAYYDGLVRVDLSEVEPMIALPFHPSNVFSIAEFNKNAEEILKSVEAEGQKQMDNPDIQFKLTDKIINGRIKVDQGIVAGCSGGSYENIFKISEIISSQSMGNDYFNFSVYPASQPIYIELIKNGSIEKLIEAGVTVKTAFCGPCFGAGDVPGNNGLSIRHTTRNFPNREGSKPSTGQIASVALMDSLSIAATAINGGVLTPATEINISDIEMEYNFNDTVYKNRVYYGFKKPIVESDLKYGPNIADWTEMQPLADNILLKVASVINDPVTTTDELIPSGETSSYRSNPLKLAEFTLSRKDPNYVGRAKDVQELERLRQVFISNKNNKDIDNIKELERVFLQAIGEKNIKDISLEDLIKSTQIGSVIYAVKPGDGSAREQAASCQKVLGGFANIAEDYATKRYRSNLINWGMIPFTINTIENSGFSGFEVGDYIFIENIRKAIKDGKENITARVINNKGNIDIILHVNDLTKDEKDIILAGSLINYNKLL